MDCPWLRRTVQVLLTAIYAAALMRETCGGLFGTPTFTVPLAFHVMFGIAVIGISMKDLPALCRAIVFGKVKPQRKVTDKEKPDEP